jgi:HEAT repeat protein
MAPETSGTKRKVEAASSRFNTRQDAASTLYMNWCIVNYSMPIYKTLILIILARAYCCLADNYVTAGFEKNPYQFQVDNACYKLQSTNAAIRASAAETLGYLRAFDAADAVSSLLDDPSVPVRREAVMTLGLIGNRRHLSALADALDDTDWTVRQGASIALQNLTGMTFPFDGHAAESKRDAQAEHWRTWIKNLTPGKIPGDITILLESTSLYDRERAIRAIGALGGNGAQKRIIPLLSAYTRRDAKSREEKLYVQACIRSLGRLGGREATQLLINLLDRPQWAFYAADALGDCGGEYAAEALLAVYPDCALSLNRSGHRDKYGKRVKRIDPHDNAGLSCIDRIIRTPYSILLALSRIPFTNETTLVLLKKTVPRIIANMPNDFDATVAYEIEPWQMLTAYLLERASMRNTAVNAVFSVLGQPREVDTRVPYSDLLRALASHDFDPKMMRFAPYAGGMLTSLCRSEDDIPLLIPLLNHSNGWIKINTAKALMFLNAREAVDPIMTRLANARDDAEYGYSADFHRFYDLEKGDGYDEYNDPCPRYKEAFIRVLGRLGATNAIPLLHTYLTNANNVLEIQYAAAQALYELDTPEALSILKKAESNHPYHSIRLAAREALWKHGIMPDNIPGRERGSAIQQQTVPSGKPRTLAFIKGDHDPGNAYQIPRTYQAYTTTDSGPTYRLGRNIYTLTPVISNGVVTPVTLFTNGFVADIDVSYDGKRILFSRRGGSSDPWWHIFEINADGTGLRQITHGPYHDVQPAYMPDGRIVFSSSRIGVRDEYHGYLATGLTIMNADGSDIHCIGFNLGRDAEPCIAHDGKILFTRLELFYSRLKTEWNLLSVFPDGTKAQTLYGPERRDFWYKRIKGGDAQQPSRHRVLRIAQPQPYDTVRYIINSFSGPMLAGPGRYTERILQKHNRMAITTPYPLDKTTLLCAAGARPFLKHKDGSIITNRAGKAVRNTNAAVDYGLYYMNVSNGTLTCIYNDPATSEFEARPLQPRYVPQVLQTAQEMRKRSYTATIYCNSVFTTQEKLVKERGKYVRIVEGLPTVARHQTHMNGGIAWRNHGGAVGRILGTVPLAPDGSFQLVVPADRLFHIQVLDSDRRVVGNELIWQYARPGEAKGCIGCHEKPDSARPTRGMFSRGLQLQPIKCLPTGDEFLYRAKVWYKGHLPEEREERQRTVNSLNVIGRL